TGCDPGDDPVVSKRLLRADGGGDHGRPHRGDGTDAAVPARPVCGMVPSEALAVAGKAGTGNGEQGTGPRATWRLPARRPRSTTACGFPEPTVPCSPFPVPGFSYARLQPATAFSPAACGRDA